MRTSSSTPTATRSGTLIAVAYLEQPPDVNGLQLTLADYGYRDDPAYEMHLGAQRPACVYESRDRDEAVAAFGLLLPAIIAGVSG